MRAGVLGPDLSAQSLTVMAGENKGPDQLAGYFVELKDGDRAFRRHFTVSSLAHVAHRAAVELVKKESLKEKDTFAYYLSALRPEEKPEAETSGIAGKVKHKQVVPVLEPAPLAQFVINSELLYGAWASEEEEENFMPAFVSQQVWQEGQEQARRDPDVRNLAALRVAEDHAADEQIEREVVQPSREEHRANAERLGDVIERVEMPYEPGQTWRDEREVDRREAELDRVGMKERARHRPPRRKHHEHPGGADRDRDELQDEIEAH